MPFIEDDDLPEEGEILPNGLVLDADGNLDGVLADDDIEERLIEKSRPEDRE